MVKTTLCLLVRDSEILLAMKKRGFGEGHWNGAGGKVKHAESLEQAAVRELKEEIGVDVAVEDLRPAGQLLFYFENKPEWDQSMQIYRVETWRGEPTESEEMRPQWFKFAEIPYDTMWPDDKFWLPRFLSGDRVEGECYFDESGKTIKKFNLK